MSTNLILLNNNDVIGWSPNNPPSGSADLFAGRMAVSVWGLGAALSAGLVTNPALKVDQATASAVTGLVVTSNIAGSGLAITVVGGNAAEALTISSKGTGVLNLRGASGNGTNINFAQGTSNCASVGSSSGAGIISVTDGANNTAQLSGLSNGNCRMGSTGFYTWNSATTLASGTADTGLSRIVAGVVAPTQGVSGAGWFQNTAGEAALAANFTKANATLGVTTLSVTLVAGRSYRIEGILQVSNSTAGEGVQLRCNGGTVTATTFFAALLAKAATLPVAVNEVSVALSTVLNYSTVTGTAYLIVNGFIKVNAGGTFILEAAENTTATGTMTLGAGSWLAFYDTVPL